MERAIYLFIILVLFLQHMMNCISAKNFRNITTDHAALLSLKAQITLDPYRILENNWSSSSFVCDWVGVTCSLRHERVIALDISGMNVTGTLPPQIGDLSFLAFIDLSRNNFHGNLPKELAKLRRLQAVELCFNNFNGQIPAWLGTLSRLRFLSLGNNSFAGFIPQTISNLSKLEYLALSFNSLQGIIPKEIGDLHNLKVLDLEGNKVSGSIPSEIFNISTLETIALGENELYGELPIDMCCSHSRRLTFLGLSSNALAGQIPLSISNCSELRVLHLSYNKFIGVIPADIGKLGNLIDLQLGANGFSEGVIPEQFGNLRNLKILCMEKIHLIGSITPALFNISALQVNNDLQGEIRTGTCNLCKLEILYLNGNRLSGSIPPALFNISTLQFLSLEDNDLQGEIPKEMNNVYKLEDMNLAGNNLTGSIPLDMFNMSKLKYVSLDRNHLWGTLPSNMGNGLPNLEHLSLFQNNLGGVLPGSLSNSTRLKVLQIHGNEFKGEIPNSFGDLRLLKVLNLHANNLTSQGLKFITSLTKCHYLENLDVSENPLDGNLPVSIGNFTALKVFYAYDCKIRGSIPSEIGNSSKLIGLYLPQNFISGPVPATMKAIQSLDLSNNFIEGFRVDTLCELENLFELYMNHNKIFGSIPSCLGLLTSLQHLLFSNNGLTSIPPTIWSLKNLINLNLSSNSLNGYLPKEMRNLKAATYIDLSMNQFSGEIPNVFTDMSNLKYLHLDHNNFGRSIPDSLGKVVGLEELDLSHNNLSGSIPKSFEALQYLKIFNVSFNELQGEIPLDGPFKHFNNTSFMFNDALCGNSRFHVSPCPDNSTNRRMSIKKLLLISLGITLPMLVMSFVFLLVRYKRKRKISHRSEPFSLRVPERISYYDLLEATGKYNESNLLGSGSYGSVYLGILKDGTFVAIKVFNLQLQGAFKSFATESKVLRNVRHRNLIKVISSCYMEDFKALILQYMPNGSLEKWLYSHNYFLNFIQRLNIMIDVASALEYLHHGYSTPLVHCDLKPSNVLLSEDMVAHVSDFGIAKLLGRGESISYTNTLATMGYIAPEYGLQGLVSTRCDVYSFGILMMEVFTRTKPSDEMFAADLSLKQWVSNFTPYEVIQVVDANLIRPNEEHFAEKLKCLSFIMELALSCSAESPNERINMKDVLAALKKTKHKFLANCEGN